MPYYGYGFNSYDIYLVLLVALLIVGLIAQNSVKSAFKKYSQVRAASGVRACDAAYQMLLSIGSGAQLTRVSGSLTDHFNPKTNTVGLSEQVYDESSIAALAVAAHEIGHVAQSEEGYGPMKLRNVILPVARIGCTAAPWIVLLGVLLGFTPLAEIGVILYGAMLLFQVATLPVEFNASRRGLAMLAENGFITPDESPAAKKVLSAAASTYVVAALSTLVSFLRLAAIASRSRRN